MALKGVTLSHESSPSMGKNFINAKTFHLQRNRWQVAGIQPKSQRHNRTEQNRTACCKKHLANQLPTRYEKALAGINFAKFSKGAGRATWAVQAPSGSARLKSDQPHSQHGNSHASCVPCRRAHAAYSQTMALPM